MNGVINIYKEAGYSSFHVIYELRRLTGEQKAGHTGTLDPQVSGVLPVCLGKATKLVGQLTDTDKEYKCIMLIGQSTDTQDAQGKVINSMSEEKIHDVLCGKNRFEASYNDHQTAFFALKDALSGFMGDIMQIPPMYSALKVGGMKLVNAARKGIEVERKPRKVTIYSIDDIFLSDDIRYAGFTVSCSKGTYIRTLCHDLGEKLGIPCCMYSLERTKAAGLGIESAITLAQAQEFSRNGTLDKYIIPTDSFLKEYPEIVIDRRLACRVIFGNQFRLKDLKEGSFVSEPPDGQVFRIYDENGLFYALYLYDSRISSFKCIKMFTELKEKV